MSPLVNFKGVVKRFGPLVVLNDFSFAVQPGEKVTLIGPSGSGKSTVLRVLMTLEPFEEGSVEIDGVSYHEPNGKGRFQASERHLRQIRSRVGMVFQSFNLFPHMTVLRNLIEAPMAVLKLGRAEAEARAVELLGMVGLTEKRDAYPASSPVGNSSAWPSPGRWRCARACCCSTSPPARWTRNWWAKCRGDPQPGARTRPDHDPGHP